MIPNHMRTQDTTPPRPPLLTTEANRLRDEPMASTATVPGTPHRQHALTSGARRRFVVLAAVAGWVRQIEVFCGFRPIPFPPPEAGPRPRKEGSALGRLAGFPVQA